MIKTVEVKPHKEETYNVGVDDSCLYIKSNHLSYSMCKWIAENYPLIFQDIRKSKGMPVEEFIKKLEGKI